MMKTTLAGLLAASTLFAGSVFAQRAGYVYHSVGPAMFTNATSLGYADGQPVVTNFYCGVYAGPDATVLVPAFAGPDGFLRRCSAGGGAFFSGSLTVTVPSGESLLVQFRVWPALYESYEQALARGGGEVLAGVSAILPAIPPDLMVELPIRTGPIWVSVVPEPAMLPLAAGGAGVFLALTRRRKAIATAGGS